MDRRGLLGRMLGLPIIGGLISGSGIATEVVRATPLGPIIGTLRSYEQGRQASPFLPVIKHAINLLDLPPGFGRDDSFIYFDPSGIQEAKP